MDQVIKGKEYTQCPECKSKILDKDCQHGELICHSCGLVLADNLIDYGPEWQGVDSEQYNQRARTGAPLNELIADRGLSTTISWKNRDHYGNAIPKKNRFQMYRIRKWHKRTKLKRGLQYNIQEALQFIMRISSLLGLPRSVQENSAVIYRKAAVRYLVRGRSIEGMAAAAIYTGCRQCNIPRSLGEISKASGISRKEISRNYRFISRELSLKLLPTKPQDFLNRFSSRLGLSISTIQKARELIDRMLNDSKTSGCSPSSIAAAAIYVATILCDERKTQEQVAKASGVTEVTIRSRYKEICNKLNIDIAI